MVLLPAQMNTVMVLLAAQMNTVMVLLAAQMNTVIVLLAAQMNTFMVLLAAQLNTVMVLLATQLNLPHVFNVLGFSLAFQVSIIYAHQLWRLSQGSEFCVLDPALDPSLAMEFHLHHQSKRLLCSFSVVSCAVNTVGGAWRCSPAMSSQHDTVTNRGLWPCSLWSCLLFLSSLHLLLL